MTLGPSVAAMLQLPLLVSGDVGVDNLCHVTIFIADFGGFEAESEETIIVDVIEATNVRPQWVSLGCAIKPGSFPKPIIEWVRHTAGDPGDEMVVVEDLVLNTIRFVDDGLILETTSEAITDQAYYCRVTNPEFTAGRDPITHTFRTGQLVTKYMNASEAAAAVRRWERRDSVMCSYYIHTRTLCNFPGTQ